MSCIQSAPRHSDPRRQKRLLSPLRFDGGTPRWEKALWKRHPEFEDNYVPPDFLASTKVKFDARQNLPSLGAIAIRQAVPQTTFTSFISLVISVFRSLLERSIGAADLLLICASGCVIAGICFKVYYWWNKRSSHSAGKALPGSVRLAGSANYILPPFLLYLCSPLLLSLTKATTSDSIWPLAGGLFMLSSILGGFGGNYQDEAKADEDEEGLSATSPVASRRTVVRSPVLRRGERKRRASAASLTAPREESMQEKAKMYVFIALCRR
ncbi:hypothetical protein QFC22_004133 [Naganishia vaughanmartiniae]|uniref:Uncharacterized protein n=1 Tax=Naganishia vaughanmartiniae TaxID=1424756 RepID=A0ACC2X589_9TREE|nr:hypothetical protein QFC22_004133 [Naganishia vaughanmartiniae]